MIHSNKHSVFSKKGKNKLKMGVGDTVKHFQVISKIDETLKYVLKTKEEKKEMLKEEQDIERE